MPKQLTCIIFTLLFLIHVDPGVASTDIKLGPIIKGYGPSSAIKDADVELPENFVYKALFDISDTSKSADQHSRQIESVARFLNMHARNGVKAENMKLAVVLHGAATKDALNDVAYLKRHGQKNPNTLLIQALSEAGVEIYLCGQSAAFYNVKKSELSPNVKMALSAMTILVTYQEQGYHLIP